eukprot:GEMP01002173.1.p1 GENE.GEMP01002173.1~~GEMP01002173.1.p1  ORF type:complete len:1212 (+),score=290.70 GEMP01002173.1:310-3945(+)
MAVFCDYNIFLGEASVECASWNMNDALLAVSRTDSVVQVFSAEGELAGSHQRSSTSTALAWHPTQKVLAAGWADGSVTFALFVADVGLQAVLREDRDTHQGAKVILVKFSPSGKSCVTIDDSGCVAVWRCEGSLPHSSEQKMRISLLCNYKKPGKHTLLTFRTNPMLEPNANPSFFFAGDSGCVYLADDFGLCSERYRIKSPILVLEYLPERDMTLLITQTTIFVTFTLGADGEVNNENKVKLSLGPQPETIRASWAGPGLLATVSNETIVRIWNVEGENHILSLQDVDQSLAGDKACAVDYNARKHLLIVGTTQGRVLQWRSNGNPVADEDWQTLPLILAEESTPVKSVVWGPEGLIQVVREKACVILNETRLHSAMVKPLIATQVTHSKVLVHDTQKHMMSYIEPKFRVRGLSLSPPCVALWNGKQMQIFEYEESSLQFVHHSLIERAIIHGAISCTAHERLAFIVTRAKVELCNFQGSVKKTIQFSAEVEGSPILLDVVDSILCVATNKQVLRLWNISRSTPKALNSGRRLEQPDECPHDIQTVKLNCDGTKVALLLEGDVANNNVVVYDVDCDVFITYDCGLHRIPTSVAWEFTDPRLLMCATTPFVTDKQQPDNVDFGTTLTLFADGSQQLLLQEEISNPRDEKHIPLLAVGILVPYVYFFQKPSEQKPQDESIQRRVLRDFECLSQNEDPAVQKALLNFSYHLACGHTDDAYNSVCSVLTTTQVWENLALMCVKTRRLDVGMKCLGQMNNARAAKALRLCEESEPEPRLGLMALHLGMTEDAEEIFRQCHRFDLLNKLFQSTGRWEKALALVATEDRIHAKQTHYLYAKFCESKGDVVNALKHYEMADCQRTECPRLLCSLGLTEELDNYISMSQDPQLHRWYAQFLESKGNLGKAGVEYQKAEDILSLCRIHCFKNETAKARQLCEESNNQAACYHFARHLEQLGEFKEAMHFYSLTGRVNHSLRIAQENHFDNDLLSLALNSTSANMIKAAKMYEERGQPSQAVLLYQKAGCQTRALELCFQARLFDALCKIADDLDDKADPAILAKCAEFFMEHQQHSKSVHLLSMSKQYEKAVELCFQHDVKISEEMVEMMTPDKSAMDAEDRANLLLKVAKLCKHQGLFQLACKKYTQAGDKVKAMKSLLKCGDTEKIIFFAGTARQQEIYVLAANYLQSLDARHNDPEVDLDAKQFFAFANVNHVKRSW